MSDLIDRQAVIDAIDSIGSLDTDADREYARGIFNALPSAQQWIPCSERLPEDGLYLVTTSKGQVQAHVFSHNGNSEEYWMRCNKAWMPLPEPYKGEQE